MRIHSIALSGLAALLFAAGTPTFAQTPSADAASQTAADPSAAANIPNIPIDKLVVETCRQAWHQGGRTPDGFFAIVQRLAELSAQNRGVTLPDDKTAGARAGQWIRTQALKDPDQLLYVVVDQAVQHSIAKGRTTPVSQ